MEIIYLVPTRGRPGNALRLARAFAETTDNAEDSARLMFIVDDDDPELDNYHAAFTDSGTDKLRFGYQVGERLRLGGTLNYWAPRYAMTFEAIGFMGDDHVPRTAGWDRELAHEVKRTAGIAYGNDLIQGANLPTAVLMDSRIITALGYMTPPGITHMYLDNFWKTLGERTGRLTYRDDVVIQHVHPAGGTADWDDRYTEVNEFMGADGELYERYVRDGGMDVAVAMVREIKP